MPNLTSEVDALVRRRPGITRQELCEAMGTSPDRALKRLLQIGYIWRVRSKGLAFYPIEQKGE
jgi:hypothetical protein